MIFLFGPLPPPLHGFSSINAEMYKRLAAHGVEVFDLKPHTGRLFVRPFLAIYRYLAFFLSLLINRPRSAYFGLSGGSRQLIDAIYLWPCLIVGVRCYVHHHSFAYLNSPSILSRLLLRTLRRSRHIALCNGMRQLLVKLYRIDKKLISVVSNAAFIKAQEFQPRPTSQGDSLTIGFLSNITLEKGIDSVLAIFQSASVTCNNLKLKIAGPVDPGISDWFNKSLCELRNVEYIGPVYGVEKAKFFRSIDVFIFPTNYKNEAEPMVVLEALSFGIPVIARARGCIGELVDYSSGILMKSTLEEDGIVASDFIVSLANDRNRLLAFSHGAYSSFSKLQNLGAFELEMISGQITNET